ncbi:Dyp-type peroxidase [Streptomyces sp. NPDC059698]|uniref:Dyp-type peroxidase n=2 Tax=unclassified Streptomyces TaxID=2593676 RepID=UPI003648F797
MVCALRERHSRLFSPSPPDRVRRAAGPAPSGTAGRQGIDSPPNDDTNSAGHEPPPRRPRQQGPPRVRRDRVASVRSRPIVVGPVLRSWTNWLLPASGSSRTAYHFSRWTPRHSRGDKTRSALFIDPQWAPPWATIRSCSVGPCHPLPAARRLHQLAYQETVRKSTVVGRIRLTGLEMMGQQTHWSEVEVVRRRNLMASGMAVALAGGGAAAYRLSVNGSAGATATSGDSTGVPLQLRGNLPEQYLALIALDSGGPRGGLRNLVNRVHASAEPGASVGFALGAAFFGPRASLPRQLRAMPHFTGDLLEPSMSHGDLLVHIVGNKAAAIRKAVERIRNTDSAHWTIRWHIEGSRPDNRVEDGRSLARNPFHFTEGFGNPDTERESLDRALIPSDQNEPQWAVGGSYQVVRIIRFATDLWDKDSVGEQERIVGRKRDGRWLDGTPVDEQPNFATDPTGRLTPLDSHVRLAAPDRRNPPPIVRRSYSYDKGNDDKGIIFSCFQRDLAQGFEAVQKRLEGESMAKYLLTTGGGYFFVPPHGDGWLDALSYSG